MTVEEEGGDGRGGGGGGGASNPVSFTSLVKKKITNQVKF